MSSDDNPFAPRTAWPRRPQNAFRIGPLPKAPEGAAPPPVEPEPEPPPQVVTPVFVRPAEPAQPFFGTARPTAPSPTPAGIRREPAIVQAAEAASTPQPSPTPQRTPTPEPAFTPPPTATPRPPPTPDAPGDPPAPSPRVVELEPLIVTAAVPERPAAARRSRGSPLPAVAATLVGVGGAAALAYLIVRNNPPAAAASAPPAVAAPAPSPAPPPAAPALVAPRAPALASAPAERTTVASHAERRVASTSAPAVRRLRSDAESATEEAINAPLLALPPPPVAAPAPARPAAATPAAPYRPPPPPDPNAPVSTERPY